MVMVKLLLQTDQTAWLQAMLLVDIPILAVLLELLELLIPFNRIDKATATISDDITRIDSK